MNENGNFFLKKSVLITGHTGFKGAWLCRILTMLGAEVTGYSLLPPTKPSLFNVCKIGNNVNSVIGDIRDIDSLMDVFRRCHPDIVIHLAAQPIVRESYTNPRSTFEINVIGTVNVLECIRQNNTVRSFLNITTDKVYENREWDWGYREIDPLDGYDPYSNSKSCSELVTISYKRSFFRNNEAAISTARAGNVFGGGDFAKDRIIPDCVRAVYEGRPINVRNPNSIRPYQHVLEPLSAYLMICEKQYDNPAFSGSYNVGPNEESCIATGELVDLFCKTWGEGVTWSSMDSCGPHEARFLKLDCSKIKKKISWSPKWGIETAMIKTVEWTKCWIKGDDALACMDQQISEFFELKEV